MLAPPWKRVTEAALPLPMPVNAQRKGYEFGTPRDEWNTNGSAALAHATERREVLEELYDMYRTCTWVGACVDTISRTITGGGLEVGPVKSSDDTPGDPPRPPALDRLEALLRFVNPTEDPMQFFRRCIQELLIFGDSFIEVTWVLGEPVALWPLDPISMIEDADEHGTVTGYRQVMEDGREPVSWEPEEVIHLSMDAPRGGQYGLSPTEKTLVPATAWLFNETSIKESARRGHPPRVHVDFPNGTQQKDVDRWVVRTMQKVLGARNIGQPYTTINSANGVHELSPSKVVDMLEAGRQLRDEILSGFGVAPSKVNVIESGNLGGGTGEAQDKTFRVTTCVPIEVIVLEKLNYHLTLRGFGITDWRIKFGEIDYRDSKVVEDIRKTRLDTGGWTLNRYRAEIGEPPVAGGDDAVLVTQRQGPIFWQDMRQFGAATIAGLEAKGDPAVAAAVLAQDAATSDGSEPPDIVDTADANVNDKSPRESVADGVMGRLTEAWNIEYRKRRKTALRESAKK